jgi:DNA-binding winged helix-turn-helix (wHTH) protein
MQDLVLSTCTVDLQRRRVHRGETVTRLTSTEAALLSFLMSHPNELISRDALHTAVWGYADGVMSRAVDTAIRRLRKKVERDPRQPDHVLTVYGEGYTFVPSVRAASHGPAAVEAQVSEADGPTANSQAASDGGVLGREQELSTLVQRLSCGGLTTVVGPGGMGKSYLVAAVLEQHGSDLTGGHWLVPLSSIEESACLLNKLAETLGVVLGPALDQRAATALIASALASRGETLLVLDDFDSLIESASQAIEDLLAGAPQLRLFITSRTRPSSGLGEVVTLDSMPTHAARHMFIEQVSRLRPGYSPDEDTLQTIDALVDRLDGLPLAIELAAARLRMMTPEQMLIRLSESYSILSSHRADAAARHQGIDAMMSLSWGEVTPDERKVLAGFTYFRGGCTLEALEAVLGMVGVSGSLIDLVEGLVDAS